MLAALAVLVLVADATELRVALVHVTWAGAGRLVVHGFVVADAIDVAEGTVEVAPGAVPVGVAKTVS